MDANELIRNRARAGEAEAPAENTLRPVAFEDFVGQERLKENLQVFVESARKREDSLDHVLLAGPPGLGKTTLAHIVANVMDSKLHVCSGPALERKGDLAGILSNLQQRDVLFIDEIHRMNAAVEENLYPAMEDFQFDIVIGEGPHARSIRLPLKRFTLIGATTRSGMLTGPLRDRFGIVFRLEFYQPKELQRILLRSADVLGLQIEHDAAFEIAKRSRGTPRVANRLLKRVADFAVFKGRTSVDMDLASFALGRLDVDPAGLDRLDHRYLNAIIKKFEGGPVGIDTIAASLGEDATTLEDAVEPYLLQQGFLKRTRAGRVATALAYRHAGLPGPTTQGDLL
jgi:holliday junction DNA helicase RuvB